MRLHEVTKGVNVDTAEKIFQGLNCGVPQQWRLRGKDHWGRRKTKGVWCSENHVKKMDQREGHSQWYTILLIDQLKWGLEIDHWIYSCEAFDAIDESSCGGMVEAKKLIWVGGKRNREEELNEENRWRLGLRNMEHPEEQKGRQIIWIQI